MVTTFIFNKWVDELLEDDWKRKKAINQWVKNKNRKITVKIQI